MPPEGRRIGRLCFRIVAAASCPRCIGKVALRKDPEKEETGRVRLHVDR
jgi:hypothetical protein